MFGNWHLSRRTLLRGAGAAVPLPLLDVMSQPTARAAETAIRTSRVAWMYIPNGVADGAWQPERTDRNDRLVRLNRWMSPLQPHMDKLTIFRNMWTPRGTGHSAGTATWLTGGGFDARKIDAGGASVDQLAAVHFQDRTLLPSLELSVRGEGIFSGSLPRNSLSWKDGSTPVPRDIEPRAVFDRMFRSGQSGLASRSTLDLILDDARSLKRRASDHDQQKIDEYLESVRSIERRIQYAEQQHMTRSPQLQKALVRPDSGVPRDHETYMQTMLDMVVLAFWADATRVCTFMMDHGQSNRYFDFVEGVRGTWHALSHWKDASGRTEDDDGTTFWSSRDEKRDMYNRVTRWHTQLLARFLARLDEIQEAGASLLDNSMIVYGSSLADGHEHAEENLPLLLAGGAAGKVRPGRLVGNEGQTSMSRLHLAMLLRLGAAPQQFADATDPLELP